MKNVSQNQELLELAASKNLPIYKNKAFGEFFIFPNSSSVVSEYYELTPEVYERIKQDLNDMDALPKVYVDFIELIHKYDNNYQPIVSPNLLCVKGSIPELVDDVLKAQLALNKATNKLANADLKANHVAESFEGEQYFDYVGNNNLSLKRWVADFCDLTPITGKQLADRRNTPVIVPMNEQVVRAVIDSTVKTYVPECYLSEGAKPLLPLPVIRRGASLLQGQMRFTGSESRETDFGWGGGRCGYVNQDPANNWGGSW